MANHSSILAWEIPWTEEPCLYGVAKNWTRLSDEQLHTCTQEYGIPTPNYVIFDFFH